MNRRSLSNIDFAAFNDDISSSLLFNDDCGDLSSLVTRHDQVLRSLLDAPAPFRQRAITVRRKAPWYTSEIASQKRLRREIEASVAPYEVSNASKRVSEAMLCGQ